MFAVQATGAIAHDDRGPGRARRRSTPLQQAFSRGARSAVRLLHAGLRPLHRVVARRDSGARRSPSSASALSGNICRCTGYMGIVARGAARRRRSRAGTTMSGARQADPAARGPATHHRPRPLHGRYPPPGDAPRGSRPKPGRAWAAARDRRERRTCAEGVHGRAHSCRPRAPRRGRAESELASPEQRNASNPVLATDRVRYVGHPVAIVVADEPLRRRGRRRSRRARVSTSSRPSSTPKKRCGGCTAPLPGLGHERRRRDRRRGGRHRRRASRPRPSASRDASASSARPRCRWSHVRRSPTTTARPTRSFSGPRRMTPASRANDDRADVRAGPSTSSASSRRTSAAASAPRITPIPRTSSSAFSPGASVGR